LLGVVVTLLAWMRRMTVNSGSRADYDWDEYSSEFEDDYEDEVDHYSGEASAAAAATASTATSTQEEETDWVMGSDGYWWYHDKATNEWWYKDANGEIVKHP